MRRDDIKPGDEFISNGQWLFVLTAEDYRRLLDAAGADDMLLWCEQCGAWIDRDDPAAAHTEDFDGCWAAATDRDKDTGECRKHRVSERVNQLIYSEEARRRLAQSPEAKD